MNNFTLDFTEEEKDIHLITDMNFYRETHIALRENLTNSEIVKNYLQPQNKLEILMKLSANKSVKIIKTTQSSNFLERKMKIKWDNTNLAQTIKYCAVPRFLIVEVILVK